MLLNRRLLCGICALWISCGVGVAPLPPLPELSGDAFTTSAREELATLRRSLDDDPRDAAANGRLGMLLHAHELYQGARACYQRAQSLEPENFRWPYLLGIVETTLGNPEAAAESIRQSIELQDHPPARIRLGNALLAADDLETGRQAFEDALQSKTPEAAGYYGLGKVLAQQGQVSDAVRMLEKAAELDPEAGGVHYALALAYRDLGSPDVSNRHLALSERYNQSDPGLFDAVLYEVEQLRRDQNWFLGEGQRLEAEGDLNEAVKQYQAALEIEPDFAAAHVNLVAAYAALGRFGEAEPHYHKALAIDPGIEELHHNWGVIQIRLGRHQQAEAAFRRALEINPYSADGRFNLGALLYDSGRRKQGLRELEEALKYAPNHALAHFQLGLDAVRNGRIDEGIAHYEKALETPVDANTPRFLHALADAHFRAGRRQVAAEMAEQALAVADQMGLQELAGAIREDLQSLRSR